MALAGVPLLSGFWSKDEILAAACEASHCRRHCTARSIVLLFIAGLVTAGLTAFYTFRAYFLTFWGEERIPHEAGHHAHESPPVMTVPLMVLAVGAPFGSASSCRAVPDLVGHFLEHVRASAAGTGGTGGRPRSGTLSGLMLGSRWRRLGGIALAWWMYVRRPALPADWRPTCRGCTSCRGTSSTSMSCTTRCSSRPLTGCSPGVPAVRPVRRRRPGGPGRASCRACSAECSGRCRTAWCSSTPWRWSGLAVFLLAVVLRWRNSLTICIAATGRERDIGAIPRNTRKRREKDKDARALTRAERMPFALVHLFRVIRVFRGDNSAARS